MIEVEGTAIIAMLFKDGFIIGTDGRVTTKSTDSDDVHLVTNEEGNKLIDIGGVHIALSGSEGRCNQLREHLETLDKRYHNAYIIKMEAEIWLRTNANTHIKGAQILIAGYYYDEPNIYIVKDETMGVYAKSLKDHLCVRAHKNYLCKKRKSTTEEKKPFIDYSGNNYESATKLPLLYVMGSGSDALTKMVGYYRNTFPDPNISDSIIHYVKAIITRTCLHVESCGGLIKVAYSKNKTSTVETSHAMEILLQNSTVARDENIDYFKNDLFVIWKNPVNRRAYYRLRDRLHQELQTRIQGEAKIIWLVARKEIALFRVTFSGCANDIYRSFDQTEREDIRQYKCEGKILYITLGSIENLQRVWYNSFFSS